MSSVVVTEKREGRSSFGLYCFAKCGNIPPSPDRPGDHQEKQHEENDVVSSYNQKKPAGWKVIPLILGNETFERLATYGMSANFMVYLIVVYHMEQVAAASVVNIWNGVTNFAPLIGAFIADAVAGRFKTIAFASFAAILGMVTVTLTSGLPHLHPANCPKLVHCQKPTSLQLVVLFIGLGLLSVGTGGIRPNSIPFGVDQFDQTTEKGRKGISSFFNWYYATFTFALTLAFTIVVYVQSSISWALGFSIPTALMVCSIALFFAGKNVYIYAIPEGSIFSNIAQVFVAAYKKRGLNLPDDVEADDATTGFYDPPAKETFMSKPPLTNQFRCLNKAAMISTNDLNLDGSVANEWRLCSVQRVEELKSIVKVGPIWSTGIIGLTALTQQATFTVSQALIMDRRLGQHKNFEIPASSMVVVSMMTVAIWLPFYDRVVIPALRKITKREGGITLLQRIGIGLVFSVLSMVIAGLIERERREMAIRNKPMSVFWLVPQLVVMGFYEAFNATGQIEFYNKEFPDRMKSVANSLFFCSLGLASYVSALVISVVHKVSGWLVNDLNSGRLDYFYFLLAGMGFLNLGYFLVCASRYKYKVGVELEGKGFDVEMSSGKI